MALQWLREVEVEHDKLMAENDYEDLVVRRRADVVRKSDAADDVMYRVTERSVRSDPAPVFTEAQSEVLAEVIARLKDELDELRKTVRANDVAALHGKVDALLALLSSPARTHEPKKGEVIDLLPNWRRRDAS